MLLLWWIWHWHILGWKRTARLPTNLIERDHVIADRAAATLDKALRQLPSDSYGFNPYAGPGKPKFVASTEKATRLLTTTIARVIRILEPHSLPGHLLNALLRDRDPATLASSRAVQEQVKREAAEEKAKREAKAATTIPPPAMGAGGSKGTL
jgi:hypothetical protein